MPELGLGAFLQQEDLSELGPHLFEKATLPELQAMPLKKAGGGGAPDDPAARMGKRARAGRRG